jgi:hypothetical protein
MTMDAPSGDPKCLALPSFTANRLTIETRQQVNSVRVQSMSLPPVRPASRLSENPPNLPGDAACGRGGISGWPNDNLSRRAVSFRPNMVVP